MSLNTVRIWRKNPGKIVGNETVYIGGSCFFKNNFFDKDLELKSNLEKDGEDGILRYFDINRREKVFAWIFFLFLSRYSEVSYSKISGIGIRVEGMERFLSRVAIRGKKERGKFCELRVISRRTTSFFRRCVGRILLFFVVFLTIIVRKASKRNETETGLI